MYIFFSIVAGLAIVTFFYMRQDKFGRNPSGERLARIEQSPNYRDGSFQNQSKTTTLVEGYSYWDVIVNNYFTRHPNKYPETPLPSVQTDLKNLPADSNVLVWFGHSSYFIQVDGVKILMDPVFSGNASPVPGTVKSFQGSDVYAADDLPEIDYLFISHDHYDHVDYETIIALQSKVKHVVCGLGVGEHFEYWGYRPEIITECDWYDQVKLENGLIVNVEPARHFSGRGFKTNNTLWASYVLQTSGLTIYLGGDSGYDKHYAEIGGKYEIDLAILDNGQYDPAWRYIHNLPEDVIQAAKDLNAKRVFPVHSSKFALASHAWNEPLKRLMALNETEGIPMVTPMIGQVVHLNDTTQAFERWWER